MVAGSLILEQDVQKVEALLERRGFVQVWVSQRPTLGFRDVFTPRSDQPAA